MHTFGQRILRRFDPGYLVVLLIGLIAVWPFLSRAGLPEGTDAELHIFRLYELSQLVRGGELYPRWAPDFYHGYGYPIFNYYAPLTYYLGLPLELLPRVDAVLATKALLVAGILLAGIGCYGFVRDNWGRVSGLVAAAMMMYAPYVQYIDPHIRGAVPESFSFAVFALALWALDRLRRQPSLSAWAASVALVAAVILTHNLMALLFFGLLAAWVLWQLGLAARRRHKLGLPLIDRAYWLVGTGARLILALALGLCLAAFFWLPVILERNAVNLTTLIGSGNNYDFRTHFLSLREMLSFSQLPDWGATQSPFLFNVGVAQWTGAVLALVLMLFGRVRHRAHLLYFAVMSAVLLFLMLPISEPLWAALSFMAYFQFPWRLLGGLAVLFAVLAGAGYGGLASVVAGRRARQWLPTVGVALPMLLALPLSQPTPWWPFGEVNLLRLTLIENSGRWLGTTSTADYVPNTVEMLPERKESVVGNFSIGQPLDRVNRVAMPDGTTIDSEYVRPLLTRYRINAPEAFLLRLYQFDFPGWQVTLDGEPATTELAKPEGFIAVQVPQGEHIVEMRFGTTPARTAAWLVSVLSLLAAVGYGWVLRRHQRAGIVATADAGALAWRKEKVWPTAFVAGAITLGALVLQPIGLFHHQSTDLALDRPATGHVVNFGDQIALLGYDWQSAEVQPGDELKVLLFWKVLRPLDIDFQSFVHVYDETGALVSQADKLNPGEFPTRRWPTDRYVPDEYALVLPVDLAPGRYRVATGLWVQSEGWRLPVLDPDDNQIGDTATLFEFEVK